MFLKNKGFCPCCGKKTQFQSETGWLRDNYYCMNCKCKPRERALMSVIEQMCPDWRDLTIHESSPMNRGASVKLKKECAKYIPSHFMPDQEFGIIVNGYKNINLEKQDFDDNTFDLVITQDVFEHLYDPASACREIYRTLKPGGAHICTIPMVNGPKSSEKWSILVDGKVEFLKKPEYHGNPINNQGSPVSFHYGYDLCFLIQKWSKLSCTIVSIDDLTRGIRAKYNEVIIMKKDLEPLL